LVIGLWEDEALVVLAAVSSVVQVSVAGKVWDYWAGVLGLEHLVLLADYVAYRLSTDS
jgi:hypothetical protein